MDYSSSADNDWEEEESEGMAVATFSNESTSSREFRVRPVNVERDVKGVLFKLISSIKK